MDWLHKQYSFMCLCVGYWKQEKEPSKKEKTKLDWETTLSFRWESISCSETGCLTRQALRLRLKEILEKAKLEASNSIAFSHSWRMKGFRPGVEAAGTPFSCGTVALSGRVNRAMLEKVPGLELQMVFPSPGLVMDCGKKLKKIHLSSEVTVRDHSS